jgi:hypothetical protein
LRLRSSESNDGCWAARSQQTGQRAPFRVNAEIRKLAERFDALDGAVRVRVREDGPEGKLRGRPSPPVYHTRDRGDERGLNSPPDERGPAVVEYDD